MTMKKEAEKTLLEKYLEDPEFAKLMAQGELIMEVTETLCELMEKEGIARKELAERLGKSKGFISQLLNGGRNLTLRTVADILHVLGYKVSLTPYKEKIPAKGGETSARPKGVRAAKEVKRVSLSSA